MPAPRISIQPDSLQVRQPRPSHRKHEIDELHARLGEREEVGAEQHLALGAEELAREVLQRALQVAEREAAVDGEALDLLEHRRVRRVQRIAAVDAARADHVHGRRLRLHRAHLDRRGLRAQADAGETQSVSESAFAGWSSGVLSAVKL